MDQPLLKFQRLKDPMHEQEKTKLAFSLGKLLLVNERNRCVRILRLIEKIWYKHKPEHTNYNISQKLSFQRRLHSRLLRHDFSEEFCTPENYIALLNLAVRHKDPGDSCIDVLRHMKAVLNSRKEDPTIWMRCFSWPFFLYSLKTTRDILHAYVTCILSCI